MTLNSKIKNLTLQGPRTLGPLRQETQGRIDGDPSVTTLHHEFSQGGWSNLISPARLTARNKGL